MQNGGPRHRASAPSVPFDDTNGHLAQSPSQDAHALPRNSEDFSWKGLEPASTLTSSQSRSTSVCVFGTIDEKAWILETAILLSAKFLRDTSARQRVRSRCSSPEYDINSRMARRYLLSKQWRVSTSTKSISRGTELISCLHRCSGLPGN